MKLGLRFWGFLLVGMLAVSSVSAIEIKGTVSEANKDVATVVTEADVVPSIGDKAWIFFKIPGADDEVSVAEGSVSEVTGANVMVKIEKATGAVEKGLLVRFSSASPTVVAPGATPAASATGPAAERKRHFDEGLAKSQAKDYKGAAEAYTKSIQADPTYAEAYINRALSYLKLKQLRPALADLNEALRLKPDFVAAHVARGNAYVGLHQYEKAIADYDEAIRLDPKDASAYNNRGGAYYETRRYKNAIEDFTKAIELDPAYPPAFLNRANAYEMMGKKQLAKADRARAKELQTTGD